ncbi:MAG: TldD/PmbA family protein [candidate division WOR-3 bacterium]
MIEELKNLISKIDADYSDIRYEIKKEVKIIFSGKELVEVSSNSTDGYVLRILKRGGFATVTFTKKEDSGKAIRDGIENAILITKNKESYVNLAKVEPIKDVFIPKLTEDPRNVSMEEKIELLRKYNSIPFNSNKVITTNINYNEVIREKYFVSSEGSEIREDLITLGIRGTITVKEGNLLQNIRVGFEGSDGFRIMRDKENEFEDRTKIAIALLKASPVKGGIYNVVLNPELASVFTHEAFGHFSEADLIEDNPSLRAKLKIGEKLGSEKVNIIDDATIPGQLGFYKYDDEGVKVRPTFLMKEGILVGRLHSRRTAAAFGEPITGHCVAEDYRYPPIIRMGNIFIQPGESSFEELLDDLGDGLYLLDAKGGETSGENFTFGAQYGYEVKNGKIGKMIREINISGNLYKTLENIKKVGNDLSFSKVGGCGKGQINIKSSSGAPHILVERVVVGGR